MHRPTSGGLCVLAYHSGLHLALLCSLLGALCALQLFQELAGCSGWQMSETKDDVVTLHICTAPKHREQMLLATGAFGFRTGEMYPEGGGFSSKS